MLPYFIILVGLSGLAFLVQAQTNRAVQQAHRGRARGATFLTMPNIVWFVIIVVLVLFAGLRSPTVGTDTFGYVQRYVILDLQNLYWDYGGMELGSKVLYFVALLVSNSPASILIIFAMMTVPTYIMVIRRESINPAFSLFLFIALGYYLFVFNGARQAVAAAFYMLAISAMIHGKLRNYLLWTVFAALFHTSVIVALPLYFLFRQPFSLKILASIMAAAAFVVLFSSQAFSLFGEINQRYATYLDREETGGLLLSAFYIITALVFIVLRPSVPADKRKRYDIYLNLSVLGTAVYIAVLIAGLYVELTRVAFYFQISTIFLWPMVIQTFSSRPMRLMVTLGIIVIHMGFYFMFLEQIGNLTPYSTEPYTY